MNDPSSRDQSTPGLLPALPLGDLLTFGSRLGIDGSPEDQLREVAETLRRVVDCACVYVRLRMADTDEFVALAFAGLDQASQTRLRDERVLPSAYQPLLQADRRIGNSYLLPPGVAPTPAAAAVVPREGSILLVPLRGRGDRLLGMIAIVCSAGLIEFEPARVQVIEAIARQSALAVENVRLAERSARLLAKEQLLAELGREIGATLDLPTILQRTIARLDAAFGSGSLALIDDDGLIRIQNAASSDAGLIGLTYAAGADMIGQVVQIGRSLFVNQYTPAHDPPPPNQDWRSVIVAPLRSGGRVIGTINVGSATPAAFTYEDVDLIEAIAAQVGGPIASARLYQESQRLATQVQRRAEQLSVLNNIARAATTSLDHEQSLAEVTNQIHAGFGYAQVDLFLVDEETNELVLAATAGVYPRVKPGYRQHINLGLVGRVARTGQAIRSNDVRQLTDYLAIAERDATRSEVCVPVVASGRTLGVMNVEALATGAFGDEDIALLTTVADVLAGAIENIRLYRRAQIGAVLEERNRLARELHDSVTQQLFSMVLTAQAARTHFERNPARVAGHLERLQETATAALAEMRALILQLRPPALRDQGLVAALQQHAQVVSRREGLAVALQVTGDERMARGIEQPIYRIVQEALNNVVKHAQARNVTITIEFTVERVQVRIDDDGLGFDPAMTPAGDGRHLGIMSMRERAAEIGGTMQIQSQIGSGTGVIVTIPREP
jgi:signal transduction histidine kinase